MTDKRGGASAPPSTQSPSASGALGLDTKGTLTAAAAPPAAPEDKPELPWAFIDCPTDTLVILIAHMLDLLCQHNDQVVLTPDALTRFHSRAPPNITVIDYLRRIVKYTNLEKIPLLSLLAYIDLTCQNLPTFTLSSLTVHRFLIAGVTAGSKAQCDVFCTNSHYAKVGGIKVGELNSLEREFLRVTGWALCCNADLLQRYYTSLIHSHGGFRQAVEPAVSPFRAFPDAGKPAPTPQEDSMPATPVDGDGEEAMGSGSEYGSDEDEDCETNGVDVDIEAEAGAPEEAADAPETEARATEPIVVDDARGRARSRGNTMEVDSPEVRSTPAPVKPPAPAPAAAPASAPSSRTAQRGTSSDSAKTLKQFVGGIFRRGGHDTAHAPPPSAPAAASASPEKRLKSRPVGEHTPPSGGIVPQTSADMAPKPLTPRVRTRDERSVDSLRGAQALAPPVGGDDSKRRARVE